MIRQRANAGQPALRRAARRHVVSLTRELQLDVLERPLALAATAPARVARLQQLRQVLGSRAPPGCSTISSGRPQAQRVPSRSTARRGRRGLAPPHQSTATRPRRPTRIARTSPSRRSLRAKPRRFGGIGPARAATSRRSPCSSRCQSPPQCDGSESAGRAGAQHPNAIRRLECVFESSVLVAALVACACAALPSIAAAHGPVQDRALTIHNSPPDHRRRRPGADLRTTARPRRGQPADRPLAPDQSARPFHDHRPDPDRRSPVVTSSPARTGSLRPTAAGLRAAPR